MAKSFVLACVQNSATDDIAANIAECDALVRSAAAAGADFICLPENFSSLQRHDSAYLSDGHSESGHPALPHFKSLAAELRVWLLLGSLTVKISPTKVNNRGFLIAADGTVVARYNKIHLFDVELKGGEHYAESATVAPGDAPVLATLPWGTLGMTICYDVRFAYLYRALAKAGADFLTIPAAFTGTTGEAHWHVLVRARAIETGCFVAAPGQCGRRPWGRRTYGHSLIVDPWGEILAEGDDEPGFVSARIDPDRVVEARQMIPALNHDRAIKPIRAY